jgi:hypothetical protein
LKNKSISPTKTYNGLLPEELKSSEKEVNSKNKDVLLLCFSLKP